MTLAAILAWTSVTAAVSAVATGVVFRFSHRSLVDVPNERSSHTRPTPTGGGMGFLAAFAVCSLVVMAWGGAPRAVLLLPALGIVVPLGVIGFIDDKRHASLVSRLVVQAGVCAALVSVYGRFPLPLLPDTATGVFLSFLLCTAAAMAVVNFYNFMDGADGLVAGCTAVQMVFWGIWQGQPVWWLLAGALAGFLFWNWNPARIFMGDVGSTVLGAFVVVALLAQTPARGWSWQYLIVTLPLVGDAGYTLFRRLLRGENPLVAHNSHIYERMIRARLDHSRIAMLYVALAAAMALLTNVLGGVGLVISACLFAGFVAGAEMLLARRRVPFAV